MKILLLSDKLGWIVDRLSMKMKELIPQDIEVDYYTTITPDEFIRKANDADIVHFNNWDVIRQLQLIPQIKSEVLISVRSFRYPDYVSELQKFFNFHIINPIPEKSPWGFVGGWVKSVIKPDYLKSFYGATIQYPDIAGKYYFEIFAQ